MSRHSPVVFQQDSPRRNLVRGEWRDATYLRIEYSGGLTMIVRDR
ncbi:hypothetical protein M758_UG150600 [Ceratodon purpureus]|nr:hypothetical protein M758_UG150600 [Ceratodon purpureus]